MILDAEGLLLMLWVDSQKNLTHGCMREIQSPPARPTRAFIPRSHHRSGVAAARITRGEARRARRMDPQEGPWSAATAERYCAAARGISLVGVSRFSLALSRLSLLFSLPCSVAARALSSLSLPAQPDRLTPFISRYLFTPTFYCHWIPTEQRAVRSPAAIHRHYKVIKSNLSNSLARVFLRNLAAGGPHAAADFHLRSVLIYREAISAAVN